MKNGEVANLIQPSRTCSTESDRDPSMIAGSASNEAVFAISNSAEFRVIDSEVRPTSFGPIELRLGALVVVVELHRVRDVRTGVADIP